MVFRLLFGYIRPKLQEEDQYKDAQRLKIAKEKKECGVVSQPRLYISSCAQLPVPRFVARVRLEKRDQEPALTRWQDPREGTGCVPLLVYSSSTDPCQCVERKIKEQSREDSLILQRKIESLDYSWRVRSYGL